MVMEINSSILKESKTFLGVFLDVSRILHIESGDPSDSNRLFNIDETLDTLKSDEVFIKIVISLHMNINDPGLGHIIHMSNRFERGDSIEEIVRGLGDGEIKSIVGLLKQVLKGIKYSFKNDDKIIHGESIRITDSFLSYMEQQL